MTRDDRAKVPAQAQTVIDMRTRKSYRPSFAEAARQQVAIARQRAGLSPAEFAEVLASLLNWRPNAETIESWETSTVPPGDVLMAVGVIAQEATQALVGERADGLVPEVLGRRLGDVEAVFPTRSEFASKMPPHTI